MFKAVFSVKFAESSMELECKPKEKAEDAFDDIDNAKKIWHDEFISGEVVTC